VTTVRPARVDDQGGDRVTTDELSDRSIGHLVQRLSQQTATLVRQEMRLAQVELQEKGRRAGRGAGMFGGAGIVALYGAGALIAAAILLIGTAVEPWLAAVIVGVVLLALAGLLALLGKKQVQQATPPKPERAMESVQRDVEHVKESARR
jgi:membrane protein